MSRDRERQKSRKDLGKARRASRRTSVPEEPESTAGKTGFSEDGQYFFGPSPSKKREMRRTKEDRRNIDPIKDLDLNAAPRKAPKQVGTNVRLIDLAMDDQQFRPPPSDKDEDPSGGTPSLPPFKKINRGPSVPGSSVPRATRAFAGRKSGRRFSNVVGKGAVKTRSLPGASKVLSNPPVGPKPGPGVPKSKQVTRPPRRSESELARGSQVRKGPAPTRPRPGPPGKGPAPSGRPGPRPGPRPGLGPGPGPGPGPRPGRPGGVGPASGPGPSGVRPKGIQRPPRPTGQSRRPQ